NLLPRLMTYALQKSAAEIAPYLDAHPPSREALHRWATNFAQPNLSLQMDERGLYLSTSPIGGKGYLLVLDSQYQVLVSVPDPLPESNVLEDSSLFPFLQQTLDGTGGPMYARRPDGTVLATAPIVGRNGNVVGVMVAVFRFPVTLRLFLSTAGQIAGKTLLLLIGPVSVISLLTGIVVSRPMARRLQRIEQITGWWKQGNLAARIEDHRMDELGQLASRLDQMAAQLQDLLSVERERASREERRRIARDLHDTLKQRLFAIHMQIAALRSLIIQIGDKATVLEVVDRITEQVQQAQGEIAQVIHNFWPPEPEKDMVETIQAALTSWSRWSGIKVMFHSSCIGWAPPPGVREVLQRILQEALTNVVRHSGATLVEVILEQDADRVRLVVADNGRGFIPAKVKKRGVGLTSMEEYAHAIGGNLSVESAPHKGTRMVVQIPI
ncbi:MAG: ATP-binding protein, partial [Anaerolineales bacterium]